MSANRGYPATDAGSPFFERADLLTEIMFLLGNGSSRRGIDLEKLRQYGTVIGCNAIYRDFDPDILITIDAKMVNEIKKSAYFNKEDRRSLIITPHNRRNILPQARIWKSAKFNTSGCFAMQLISRVMQPKVCFMIGMDAYAGNIYDGTLNYSVNTLKNFSGVRRYYTEVIKEDSPTVFANVNTSDCWETECKLSKRYKFILLEQFTKALDEGSVPQLAEGAGLDSV